MCQFSSNENIIDGNIVQKIKRGFQFSFLKAT